MRLCVALAALLVGTLPAPAQDAAVKRPAIPSPAETYAAMPAAERAAIQSDLLWAGHYDGVADGDANARGIAAIRNFQRDNKTRQTGVLNPQEREVLAAAARKEREAVGWKVVEDEQSGARVGLPAKLLPQWVKNKLGSRWSSERGEAAVETFRIAETGVTLASVFNQQKQKPERKVETSQLRGDSFAMTGLQGLKKFYSRAEYKNGEVRGLTVLYDQAMHGTMQKIVDAVWSAFVPFARSETPAAAAEAKGKVEYGTGLVVSASGHILTPRHLIDGCAVIVVAGLGNGEMVAQDTDHGLALLRVYGNRRLSPLPFSTEAAPESDLTLVGVADPKAQAGGSAASSARAKLGAAVVDDSGLRAIDSVPAAGFSGAAALDSENRLLGVLRARPQLVAGTGAAKLPPAAIIPADIVRGFLAAHKIEPVPGNAGDPKASAVRVICVRK